MPQLVSPASIPITSRKRNGKRKASSLERVAAAGSSREEASKRQRIRGKLNDLRKRVEFVCTMPVQNPKECITFLFDREPDLNDMLCIADTPTQKDVSQLFDDIQYTRPLTTENLACPVGKRFSVDGVILEKLDDGSFRKVSEETVTIPDNTALSEEERVLAPYLMTPVQKENWFKVYSKRLLEPNNSFMDMKETPVGISLSQHRDIKRWGQIGRKDLNRAAHNMYSDAYNMFFINSPEKLFQLFVDRGMVMNPEQELLYRKVVAWKKKQRGK